MNDYRAENPGDEEERTAKPVPRDMPDQQAGADEDPWEAGDDSPRRAEDERPDPGVPDTDEAGTGRLGSPHSGNPRPEHPVPDESSA
ncbi:hypothetical protein [Streptomyces sp. NPDC051576]|uniref:hypothetical protein n=1 Tax=Streptomyces sp. NPDC051576 TaxID=3155803 RepID=UPI00342CEABB